MSSSKTTLTSNIYVCDASANEVIIHIKHNTWHSFFHEGRAQNVLEFLKQDSEQLGISFESPKEIGVVMEGVSFTATRVITVIANTVAFVEKTILRALPQDFSKVDDEKKDALWTAAHQSQCLIPTYSAPPNITLKRTHN